MENGSNDPAGGVVLFDGVCSLCNFWVDFVMKRDREGRLRFAPLQSEAGKRLMAGSESAGNTLPDSVVVIPGQGAGPLFKSEAILAILRLLPLPWNLLVAARLIPRSWRDALYDFVAKHRFRLFKRRESCRVPSPAERERFLD